MGDPIWLDTNTLDKALKGDPAINQQLSGYRKAGRQLLVTQRVEDELLYGNPLTMKKNKPFVQQIPSPEFKSRFKMGMSKIGVEVDIRSNAIPIEKLFKYRAIKSANVAESDRRVLSEIKASAESRGILKPQMITAEKAAKAMTAHASAWGIESVAAATPKAGAVPEPPRVILADYPQDKEGAISKYFKDRPVLKKLGIIGGTIAAQEISSKMMSLVFDHFNDALARAGKEFDAQHPDPEQLKVQAGLDRYKRAYEAALSRVNQPSNLKAAEMLILAFTRDRDIDKTKAYLDGQIAKVVSVADGRLSGYGKVASEYIDAMISLYRKLGTASVGLPDMASDIDKRGSVISAAGADLEQTYWKALPVVSPFPLAYFEWLGVKNTADSFKELGGSVLSFSTHISNRLAAYTAMLNQLDGELVKVSNEMGKYT
jgi:hypothetical protein